MATIEIFSGLLMLKGPFLEVTARRHPVSVIDPGSFLPAPAGLGEVNVHVIVGEVHNMDIIAVALEVWSVRKTVNETKFPIPLRNFLDAFAAQTLDGSEGKVCGRISEQ